MARLDPVPLAQALIRCPSVTPQDAGALDVLSEVLRGLGFICHRLPFGEGAERVDNLFARWGSGGPHFCFAGHTDVVPAGERAQWRHDPFAGTVEDGVLHGRGASDMKGAIAAFVAAAGDYLVNSQAALGGTLSLLITGDEEGPARNGTRRVLDWLRAQGMLPDHCLVGEPTNPQHLGEMIKIGRRGSLNTRLTVHGTQGHVAYPQLADNPLPRLLDMLDRLRAAPLDPGTEHFQASNLELTSIDVGNRATNVIPGEAEARFNIRFNDRHTGEGLMAWIRDTLADVGGRYTLAFDLSGEAFLTSPGLFSTLVSQAVFAETKRMPALSTSGGTSDARFIKDVCPVLEFGLPSTTMHKVNEQVAVDDVQGLARIYLGILKRYFASSMLPPPAAR